MKPINSIIEPSVAGYTPQVACPLNRDVRSRMNTEAHLDETKKQSLALFWAASLSVVFLYILTLIILPPHVFWSPDEGGKFLQTVGLRFHQEPHFVLPYGGKDHDPDLSFYPPGTVYPRPDRSGATTFGWPFLFPVLSALAYRVFGLWGIYILPLTSGVLAALLSGLIVWRIACRLAWLVVLLVGLCSPLWFYSVLFWEHSFAVLMGLAAVCASQRFLSGDTGKSRLTGLLFALGCLLLSILARFDMLIFAASLSIAVFAVLCRFRAGSAQKTSTKLLLYVLLIVAVSAATLALYSLSASGSLAFPSYWGLARRAFHRSAQVSLQMPSLMARHMRSVLINEPSHFGVSLPEPAAVAALMLFVLALVVSCACPRARTASVIVATIAISLVSLAALVNPSRYRALHGILVTAPYCTLAIAAFPRRETNPTTPRVFFLAALGFAQLVLFLLCSFLVGAETGGPEWGTRYGLIVFPLLAVLAVVGLDSLLWSSRSRWLRMVIVCSAILAFGTACQSSVRGLMEIQVTKRDLAAFDSKLRDLSLPVLTDLWWLGAALTPFFVENHVYTVATPLEGTRNFLSSPKNDVSRFVYVTYGRGIEELNVQAPVDLLSHTVVNGLSFRVYEVQSE